MSMDSRLEALRSRHRDLELKITAEMARPRPDDAMLRNLKQHKLRLKDMMAQLQQRAS